MKTYFYFANGSIPAPLAELRRNFSFGKVHS